MIDRAPVKNTCPSIDELINYLEGFKRDFLNDDNEYDFEMAFSLIEDIRDANKELREWGNSLCEELRDKDLELVRADVKIEDLEVTKLNK